MAKVKYETAFTGNYSDIFSKEVEINKKDFECPCCGKANMSKKFLKKINRLWGLVGPFKIGSAYRCPKHNEAIHGSLASPHLMGMAIDIPVTSARAKRKIVNAAVKLGFKGIGVYNGHIHVDISPRWHDEEVIWSGISR